ncbi:MAG TPA: MBL fold metallo-hydrolase [Solirubrobacteraceae bacterium]
MNVQWYGQSTFHLTAPEASVTIDPFADMSELAASRGMQFDYPPIQGVEATLLLVTHEHIDHNGVEAIGGDPTILRSTAGRLESPVGEVIAIASEHDEEAGTARGPNTIFVFELDGLRVSHFGDFGQSSLRDEQAAAIGDLDLLFIPVGGGPTIGADQAAQIIARLRPRWSCPCTTARRASGSSRPRTPSSGAPSTSNTCPSPPSTRPAYRPPTVRWWSSQRCRKGIPPTAPRS